MIGKILRVGTDVSTLVDPPQQDRVIERFNQVYESDNHT
jgi:hypothetical protein